MIILRDYDDNTGKAMPHEYDSVANANEIITTALRCMRTHSESPARALRQHCDIFVAASTFKTFQNILSLLPSDFTAINVNALRLPGDITA